MKNEICPTCGTTCEVKWYGLDMVEQTGDETLASKGYTPLPAIPAASVSAAQSGAQPFERFPELTKSIEWFANNVLCPAGEWNKLLAEINKALTTHATLPTPASNQNEQEEMWEEVTRIILEDYAAHKHLGEKPAAPNKLASSFTLKRKT